MTNLIPYLYIVLTMFVSQEEAEASHADNAEVITLSSDYDLVPVQKVWIQNLL